MFLHLLPALLTAALAVAAPTPPALDQATLLQNGQDAQTLNAEFSALNFTTPCDSGELACVQGELAQCQFGAWRTEKCVGSQQCFALPYLTAKGTMLACTSENTALSLINATGAQGGLLGNNANGTIAFPTISSQSVSSPLPTSTSVSTSSAIADDAQPTVEILTITVTIAPSPATMTLPTFSTTLDQAGASSILSSLSANGFTGTPISVTPTPTITPTASATPSADDGDDDGDCVDDDSDGDGAEASVSSSGPSPTSSVATGSTTPTATAAADGSAGYKRNVGRGHTRHGIYQ